MANFHSQFHPDTLLGTFANRPPALSVQKEGVTYFATDTLETYLSVIAGGLMTWVLQSSGGSSSAPFSHTLYVDGGTSTPPAMADGSDELPFKTIMAAVAVMVDSTAIIVMPGTYPENVVWRDLENTALIGINSSSVIISPAAGDAFSWTPGPGFAVQFFNIENLSFVSTGRNIVLDGTNTDSFFFKGAGRIQRNVFSSTPGGVGIFLRRISQILITDCVNIPGGNVDIHNVASCIFINGIFPASDLTVSWNVAEPEPLMPRQNVSLAGTSVFVNLIMNASPFVFILSSSLIIGSITDTGLVFDASSGTGPILLCQGSVGLFGGGGINLKYPEAPPGNLLLQFPQATIGGTVNISVAGPTRFSVSMRGVEWLQTNPGDVTIGDLIDMDARGSTYLSQSIFVALGGATLDRDTWGIFTSTGDLASPTVIQILPPFPGTATNNYSVVVNTTLPAAVAIPRASKTPKQFVADPGLGLTGDTDFTIVRTQA